MRECSVCVGGGGVNLLFLFPSTVSMLQSSGVSRVGLRGGVPKLANLSGW